MNKIFAIVFLLLVLSCSNNFDHTRVYDLIQNKFPNDGFIEKAIEKANEPLIITDFPIVEIEPDFCDLYICTPFLQLHHIYEIHWGDKLIGEKTNEK